MLRSLYTSVTAMLTQSRRMDAIANNISNANTHGFKKDLLVSRSFEEMLIVEQNNADRTVSRPAVGPLSLGTHVDEVYTSFEQGSLEETNNSLDIAIKGDGLFVVNTANGERYTRGGTFIIDEEGYLAAQDGSRVMGRNGPVYVGSDMFTIDGSGAVYVEDRYVDTLRILNVSNPAGLRKQGNGFYRNVDPNNTAIAFEGEIKQGFLEASNVDVIQEMVSMMEVTRNYESNQRMVRMLDESLGKTVNEVGRL